MLVHPVTLGDDVERIELLPISDFHIGSVDFNREGLKSCLRYVLSDEHRYILINGDLINNALKSSVSDVYQDVLSPRESIAEAVRFLSPVKERIIGIVAGNHERRTDKEVGISPVEIIADKLGVPYFGSEVLLKIRFGRNTHGRQSYYTVYATHGWGGGKSRGGKVNSLDRLKNVVVCDVYCMGHTHTQVAFPSVVYVPDQRNNVVTERVMWFVSSGSFQERGSGYAAIQGLEPQMQGCPIIELDGGERRVIVTMGRV
jgi:predicted phosphodiesterase